MKMFGPRPNREQFYFEVGLIGAAMANTLGLIETHLHLSFCTITLKNFILVFNIAQARDYNEMPKPEAYSTGG